MSDSPIDQLLHAMDGLDTEALIAMFAPDGRVMTVDGRRADGIDEARALLQDFLGKLRSTAHRITSHWHVHDAWIAEVEADYEMSDYLLIRNLPRVFILRHGPEGISDLRVYGAHERPLDEHRTGEEGIWVGGRWVPPL